VGVGSNPTSDKYCFFLTKTYVQLLCSTTILCPLTPASKELLQLD
jgi:hypothetical protein